MLRRSKIGSPLMVEREGERRERMLQSKEKATGGRGDLRSVSRALASRIPPTLARRYAAPHACTSCAARLGEQLSDLL